MSQYNFTIVGFVAYAQEIGENLFDGVALPGDMSLDILVDTIVDRASEFRLLSPDYDYLLHYIPLWSQRNAANWQKLYDAMTAEYNPIENYDRKEDISRKTAQSGASSSVSANDSKAGRTAFDTNTGKTVGTSDDKGAGVSASSATGEETVTARMHGNIGVTTNVDMLTQEIGFRQLYNLYDLIANSFIETFCVAIY